MLKKVFLSKRKEVERKKKKKKTVVFFLSALLKAFFKVTLCLIFKYYFTEGRAKKILVELYIQNKVFFKNLDLNAWL